MRNECQQVPTLLWFLATGRNTRALGPTMLRVVGQQCCVRLHGPLEIINNKLIMNHFNLCAASELKFLIFHVHTASRKIK